MDATLSSFTGLRAALVADALDAIGMRDRCANAGLMHLAGDAPLCGRAATLAVRTVHEIPDPPYQVQFAAVDALGEGDVVVAEVPPVDSAFWGELLSTRAQARGAAGAIIDGYTRDLAGIRAAGFAVWARGTHPADAAGRLEGLEAGVPVRCGGVLVRQRDLVVADEDGVVFVPDAVADEVAARARAKDATEDEVRAHLAAGLSAGEAYQRFGVL